MNNETLLDKCKLIAEFMQVIFYKEDFKPYHNYSLLWQAVKKIEDLGYSVRVERNVCCIFSKDNQKIIINVKRDTKMWAVFHAVSLFASRYLKELKS